MSEYGHVTMVTTEPTTSTVVAVAAPAGATSLFVDYAGGFPESGGTLDWVGVPLTYTSIVWGVGEEDPDELILAAPLTAEALVDDVVATTVGGEVLVDYIAHVVTEDGDSLEVLVPYVDRLTWPEGIYEEPVAVEISDDGTVIENAPGRSPRVAQEFVYIPSIRLDIETDATIPNNTWTAPTGWWVREVRDEGGGYFYYDGAVTYILALLRPGSYLVSATVSFVSNSTGARFARIMHQPWDEIGGTALTEVVVPAASGGRTTLQVSRVITCESGDAVWIETLQNSGAALDLVGAVGGTRTSWSVVRIG